MNKSEFENKSLVYIMLIAYVFNLIFSTIGYLCHPNSNTQMLLYQIGNSFAISGAVMAGRYTGLRGEQVAASGFILLGITHGISLAALSRISINIDRGMTMVIPLLPCLIFMFWCSLYPVWLRVLGVVPIIFSTMVYVGVQLGYSYFGWPLTLGYASLQIIEVLWAIYLFRDWKQNMQKPV